MTPSRIRSASDLVTSHRAVCEGFLSQALTKTEKATPFVQRAQQLWDVLKTVPDVLSVFDHPEILDDVVAAAGFSDKARSHLSVEELALALLPALRTIDEQSHGLWREEIVYRYLLTRGDTLGGIMRNITGALAGKQFSEAILAALGERGVTANVRRSPGNPDKVQTIEWQGRLLLFDKKPRFIGNFIDVILLDTSTIQVSAKDRLERRQDYVACGELKGGIDPAGADEHWKTANSALERIRQSFPQGQQPHLFFVGAAIEAAMAREIFTQLQDGRLRYAANFTVPEQVADLAAWFVGP